MNMTGEYRIPAPRAKVWEALNDPAKLEASLPGCESLEKVSDTEYKATVVAKVGPVKAKFNGNVVISDLNPPESYTITGEGKGGAAGFAKGGAEVRLAEDGDGTVLTYTAKAEVGGKLAQIGSRLIDGTAKKLTDEFFDNFVKAVAPPAPAPEPTPPTVPPSEPEAGLQALLRNKFTWAAAAIVVVMILALLFR
jgi:carbon monoxide dehydrogenase subunit G